MGQQGVDIQATPSQTARGWRLRPFDGQSDWQDEMDSPVREFKDYMLANKKCRLTSGKKIIPIRLTILLTFSLWLQAIRQAFYTEKSWKPWAALRGDSAFQ